MPSVVRRPDAQGPATRLYGLAPLHAPDARLLLLGSFPGKQSLAEHRYYAHPRNQFWSVLGALWGEDIVAMPYDERVNALRRHRLALWDVHAACEREGSLDSAIERAEPNDLAALVAQLPCLRVIAHHGGESARSMKLTRSFGLPVHRLPSTSPAHAGMSLAAKVEAWRPVFEQAGVLGADGEGTRR